MSSSILTNTKKTLGLEDDYEVFDQDIILYINSVFSTLDQLGIGPADGFMIEDKNDLWEDFFDEDPRLNNVKTYVYLRVRLLFDPPATSFHIVAIKEQIKELEYRINLTREASIWVPMP